MPTPPGQGRKWRVRAGSVHPTHEALVTYLVRDCGLVRDERVEAAMRQVDYAGYSGQRRHTYTDSPQSLGVPGATISAPHMHAMALQLLGRRLCPGAVALDVGCGSGYLTAVMGALCGRAYGVEWHRRLAERALENVRRANPELMERGAVEIVAGDGSRGLPGRAPFDCIHVGAAALTAPQGLLEQLKAGGRMLCPVGPRGGNQKLLVIDKHHDGRVTERVFTTVSFVPLQASATDTR